jgi:hypothetical protein
MSENLPANIIALAPGIQMVGMAALLDESATLDDVALALVTLKDFRDKPQWGIGDLLNASELRFGEKYAQIFDVTGLEYSTCQTYTSMARSFKPEERNPDIGYAYHRSIFSTPSTMGFEKVSSGYTSATKKGKRRKNRKTFPSHRFPAAVSMRQSALCRLKEIIFPI